MKTSRKVGVALGAAINLSHVFVFRIMGVASIWGFSESVGLRQKSVGGLADDPWSVLTLVFSVASVVRESVCAYEAYRPCVPVVGDDELGFHAGFFHAVMSPFPFFYVLRHEAAVSQVASENNVSQTVYFKAYSILLDVVLEVFGVAAIWGFSEATGLRKNSGDLTNNTWALATVLFAVLGLFKYSIPMLPFQAGLPESLQGALQEPFLAEEKREADVQTPSRQHVSRSLSIFIISTSIGFMLGAGNHLLLGSFLGALVGLFASVASSLGAWKGGAVVGGALGFSVEFVLHIVGSAALWGYSEAMGLRDHDDDMSDNNWALATIAFAAIGCLHYVCKVHQRYHETSLPAAPIKKQAGFIRNFFGGFVSGVGDPVVSLRSCAIQKI